MENMTMGYRSTVRLVAVVETASNCDEVLANYQMHEDVIKYDLLKEWRRVDRETFSALIYEGNDVKWYDSYLDVQALKRMEDVLASFAENRSMAYAWCEARIGEEQDDVVYDVRHSEEPDGCELAEVIYDTVVLVRQIDLGL